MKSSPNLCFVDTLDNVGLHTAAVGATGSLFGSVSEENVARIRRQNSRKISVVIGNPPYNANQANENDNNKNREYPDIDKRIKQTYIAESTAQKTKLYDMYARFFRWASDRLNENGIIAFVSNSSFVDSRTFDGFRKVLTQEFNEIWIVDLKGNARTSGERRRQEAGNIFDDQIRVGIAIWFCVKKAGADGFKIMYEAVRDYAKSDEKLSFVSATPLRDRKFDRIRPDVKNNWINLTDNDFDTMLPLASKATKAAKTAGKERAIFKLFTLGVSTNRDEWVYDDDPDVLSLKAIWFLENHALSGLKAPWDDAIKWSETLKRRVAAGVTERFSSERLRIAIYRPYVSRWLYASNLLVDRPGNMADIPNRGATICLSFGKDFRVLGSGAPFDLHMIGDTVGMPLNRIDADGTFYDNITDWALKQFTAHYKDAAKGKPNKLRKEAIFHYCYAVLHNPAYREKYAQNLKREFPRIPLYGTSIADFWQWAAWGEALMALHIGYEQVAPFPLVRTDTPDAKVRAAGLQPKALLRSDATAGSIALDSETTLRGIPPEAWTYKLGNRCAIDWVLDQYKEKKPKDPTIREKFDTYRFADYKDKVIDLLMRVTAVSVETVKVLEAMKVASH